jgi:hypothetical protein
MDLIGVGILRGARSVYESNISTSILADWEKLWTAPVGSDGRYWSLVLCECSFCSVATSAIAVQERLKILIGISN